MHAGLNSARSMFSTVLFLQGCFQAAATTCVTLTPSSSGSPHAPTTAVAAPCTFNVRPTHSAKDPSTAAGWRPSYANLACSCDAHGPQAAGRLQSYKAPTNEQAKQTREKAVHTVMLVLAPTLTDLRGQSAHLKIKCAIRCLWMQPCCSWGWKGCSRKVTLWWHVVLHIATGAPSSDLVRMRARVISHAAFAPPPHFRLAQE